MLQTLGIVEKLASRFAGCKPHEHGAKTRAVICGLIAWLIFAKSLPATMPEFDLTVESVKWSAPRLVDGGEARVRVIVTTHNDAQPESCSGELVTAHIFLPLPFSSCSARRLAPSRYELVLVRAFPAAVVNRAFHLGSLVLRAGRPEPYRSAPQPAQRLEVISTAVVPDVTDPRVNLFPEGAERQVRLGDRFRIVLHANSAAPIEMAGISLNLFRRDGRGVASASILIRGEHDWASDWVDRVEHSRVMGNESLTVYARVPENWCGVARVVVGGAFVMNQSLQFVGLRPPGLELDIQESPSRPAETGAPEPWVEDASGGVFVESPSPRAGGGLLKDERCITQSTASHEEWSLRQASREFLLRKGLAPSYFDKHFCVIAARYEHTENYQRLAYGHARLTYKVEFGTYLASWEHSFPVLVGPDKRPELRNGAAIVDFSGKIMLVPEIDLPELRDLLPPREVHRRMRGLIGSYKGPLQILVGGRGLRLYAHVVNENPCALHCAETERIGSIDLETGEGTVIDTGACPTPLN